MEKGAQKEARMEDGGREDTMTAARIRNKGRRSCGGVSLRYLDPTETKMRPRAYAAVGTVAAAGGADGFVYTSQRKLRLKLGYNGEHVPPQA